MQLESFLLAQPTFASASAPQSCLAPSPSQVILVKLLHQKQNIIQIAYLQAFIYQIYLIEGGGYGLARVTLGFYFGFMVGCCEIIEYIIYTADTCLSISNLVVKSTGINGTLAPLIWLIFYVSAVIVYCIGGKLFWRVSNLLAFLSLATLLTYFAGSFQFVDFEYTKYVSYSSAWPDPRESSFLIPPPTVRNNTHFNQTSTPSDLGYGHGNPWFLGGPNEFMRVLPLAGWLYVGIESLNFAANDVNEVRSKIIVDVIYIVVTDSIVASTIFFYGCWYDKSVRTYLCLNRGKLF